jgi:hypothetical protein
MRIEVIPMVKVSILVVDFVGVVWERFMDHLLGREPPVPF